MTIDRRIRVLLLFLALAGGLWSAASSADSLDEAFAGLMQAIADGNHDQMASAVCLDAQTLRKLGRMERLGMIDDAQDPATVTAYKEKYLSALTDRFATLARVDPAELVLDRTRVVTADEGGLRVQGILGVSNPAGAVYDVPLIQDAQGRWCIDPIVVQ